MIDSQGVAAVRLIGVQKAYAGRAALHPLSLTIGDGETVAIVGPSGSGKTTMLNTIAGVVRPDGGAVELGGRRIDNLGVGRNLARRVGIIHQQYDLVPQLSVLHNVLAGRLGEWSLGRSLLSLVWPRESDRALRALDRVGLSDYAATRVARLSGGEQQRVAIARLLVQDPRIVLADEPVASVDPARADDLLALLTGIARVEGKAVIASLHTVEYARRHFDRIVGLRDGRLQFDRPAGQVSDADLQRLYLLGDRLSA